MFEGEQVAVKYFLSAEQKRGYNQEVGVALLYTCTLPEVMCSLVSAWLSMFINYFYDNSIL